MPTITKPNLYFDVVTYTGTGATQTISGLNFQPDFVWIKSRSAATDNKLTDAVRGATKGLISNTTGAETTDTNGVTAFTSSGFTLGSDSVYNNSGATYVAWCWKANGSGSSNTAGSITSTVSANTTSGFSVVTYTGSGVAGTIGHGLGVAPSMIIIKSRSATGDWPVYKSTVGNGAYLILNGTGGASSSSTIFNATSPTSSVFSVGINTVSNTVTTTYVAYCFAPIANYSSIGSYVGNASTDGPFVFTGMKPAFVLVRPSASAEDWYIFDNKRIAYNVRNEPLYADVSAAEGSGFNYIDLLSNGFKMRNNSYLNNSGLTYIYMAFAENPFKTSLAR